MRTEDFFLCLVYTFINTLQFSNILATSDLKDPSEFLNIANQHLQLPCSPPCAARFHILAFAGVRQESLSGVYVRQDFYAEFNFHQRWVVTPVLSVSVNPPFFPTRTDFRSKEYLFSFIMDHSRQVARYLFFFRRAIPLYVFNKREVFLFISLYTRPENDTLLPSHTENKRKEKKTWAFRDR